MRAAAQGLVQIDKGHNVLENHPVDYPGNASGENKRFACQLQTRYYYASSLRSLPDL
jgi:hypothetical protein